MITKQLLNKIFEYKEGTLYYKIKPCVRINVGDKAGYLRKDGYIQIIIKYKPYLIHRLIYMYHYGVMPIEIDHIEGKSNNIENLRPANSSENNKNASIRKDNISGYKNVGFCNRNKKWAVRIRSDGKRRHIGYFDDLELADLVAQEARIKYHKEFARDS